MTEKDFELVDAIMSMGIDNSVASVFSAVNSKEQFGSIEDLLLCFKGVAIYDVCGENPILCKRFSREPDLTLHTDYGQIFIYKFEEEYHG